MTAILEALFNVHPLQLVIDQFTSFWRSLNLFTFLIFWVGWFWKIEPPRTNEDCMSQATKVFSTFPATSKRYAQNQTLLPTMVSKLAAKRWRRSSTCSASKGWKFPSLPLTNARSAESGMCLRIRSKLLSRWCWAKETASLWISWISSFAAFAKAPCTHCARTWGNKVAINVPKSWSKKADSKIDEIWAQLELRGCELNVCFLKGNACLGGKATNKANRQRRKFKKAVHIAHLKSLPSV